MSKWASIPLNKVLTKHEPVSVNPEPSKRLQFAGVKWYGAGLFIREERLGSEVRGKCYALKPGALIYNRLFAWKQSFAVVGEEYGDVVVSNEFPQFDVDTDQAIPEFLALYCSSPRFAKLAEGRSSGSAAVSRNRLKEADFLSLPAIVPPLDAQKKILDISAAVEDTRKSLQEEIISIKAARAALLHKLLDNLSAEAEETTLGKVASWSSGGTPKADNPSYYGGDIPWAVIGDVKGRSINSTKRSITTDGLEAIGGEKKLVSPGTVLVTMYGTIGESVVTEIPLATNQAICRGIPNSQVSADYLRLWISARQANLLALGEGKTQLNINKKKIEQFPITIPDPNTQDKIVEIMTSVEDQVEALELEAKQTKIIHASILDSLLAGDINLVDSPHKNNIV